MLIRVVDPKGAVPAQSPRLLADDMATSAVNIKLGNHEARPLDGPTTIETPYHGADTLAIHRYPDVTGVLSAATASGDAGSHGQHCAVSPDGKWVAYAKTASPYITVRPVDEDGVHGNRISPTGAQIPAGAGKWVAWSPDGDYLFLAHTTTPFVSAWPWTGAFGTKIVPGSPMAGNCVGVAVSPDGGYVAAITATSPYLAVWPWTGAFGTLVVPTGTDIPAGAAAGLAWTRDGRWILMAHTTTPYTSAWRWDGSLGGIRNPATADLATGNGLRIAMSPDNRFVGQTQTGAPYKRVWRFDSARGDPFLYLVPDSDDALTSQPTFLSWDLRGGFIYFGLASTPFLEGYAWEYGAFGRHITPASAMGAAVNGFGFSLDGRYMLLSHASATQGQTIDRASTSWLNWNRRVKVVKGPVANDFRNRRYYTGDGPPKKTGNDIAIPGSGSPAKLPDDWLHMGVKRPGQSTVDNEGDPLTGTVPSSNGNDAAWSPDGRYLAVAHSGSPFISVWDMLNPENPVKFANPGTLPTGTGRNIAWSPAGDFVGVAHDAAPSVSIYPWSSSGFGAKVANPTTPPVGNGDGMAWSPAGDFVGVAHSGSPFVSVYSWSGAGFGARASDPATLPVGGGLDLAWSPAGDYLAVAHLSSPRISTYPWNGAFGTKVADPSPLPPGACQSVAWSPDSAFVGVVHTLGPFVSVYPWDDGFGTRVADPTTPPTNSSGMSIAWSPDGAFVALGCSGNPKLSIYPWSSATRTVERKETRPVYRTVTRQVTVIDDATVFETVTETVQVGTEEITVIDTIPQGFGDILVPPAPPAGSGVGIAWSPGTAYLAIAHPTPPYVTIYPWASTPTARSYVVTYVTGWGEEGAPSFPVEYKEEHFVLPRLVFSGEGLGRYNITHRRIYRLEVGNTGAFFLFVGEQPISETTFDDYVPDADLGAALGTINYSEPPSDLSGLVSVQGGILAGISGKQVCLSEPFHPYAWPIAYRRTMPFTPVALEAIGSTIIVATEGQPVLLDGSHPSAMSMSVIEASQSCSNAESLVQARGGVVYASPDGLIYVTPGRVLNITRDLLSKPDWVALNPGTMIGAVYDGRIYMLYDSGSGVYKGIVLDPDKVEQGLLTIQAASGSLGTVAYSDLDTDTLYLVIGGVIKSWDTDGAGPLTGTWIGKQNPSLKPTNLGVLQVRASWPGTITVKYYADSVLKHTAAITSSAPVRLPRGFRGMEHKFEVSGTIAWQELLAAHSMDELRGVP